MNSFSTTIKKYIDFSLVDFNCNYRINLLMNEFTYAATKNAEKLGMWKEDMVGRFGWVVAKQTLTLNEPIKLEDTIEIETMPGKGSFVSFPRYYFFYKNGKCIGECSSIWTLIDLHKRTIVSPRKLGFNFPEVDHGIKLALPKVSAIENEQLITKRVVLYEDIDTNGHLNNTRHIAWAMDCIDLDYLKTHDFYQMTIQYKKEIAPKKEVEIYMSKNDNTYQFEGRIDGEVYYTMELMFVKKA